MIIDSYTHCGLDKFRPIEDVRAMMAEVGVSRAVLAQHLGQFDNSYIAACVQAEPSSLIGVAMIDVLDPDAQVSLQEVVASPAFGGIRMTAAMLRQAPCLASAALEAGLHLVLYCPDGTDEIESVLPGLASGPGRIVITHLGSPTVDAGRLTRGTELLQLAADPRIMVTLSGAGMACDPPHEPLRSLVRAIVDGFGAERVMWASNYPVVGDQGAVRADLDLLLSNAWGLPPSAIPLISADVADHTWFASRKGL
jgi:predicted TIM-barrel fold metal-dependent hydrolase